jgi:hypothetical protein
MSPEALSGIARVVEEIVKGKQTLDMALAQQVAAALAKNFKVSAEEVAVLRVSANGRHMEFIVPEKLSRIGTIPMSSVNSLAVRTARERKSEFVNNFSTSKHPTVFESVKLSKEKEGSEPIQKIVSVPIVVDTKAVGVIQISRKGKTPGAAGADFGPQDLKELNQVAAALAKCFPAQT